MLANIVDGQFSRSYGRVYRVWSLALLSKTAADTVVVSIAG